MLLKWHNSTIKLKDLKGYKYNPRQVTDKQYRDLKASLTHFGLVEIPVINLDNTIIAGHQRIKILSVLEGPEFEIDIRVPDVMLSEADFREYLIRSNANTGEWDFDVLGNHFELEELKEWGLEPLPDFGGPSDDVEKEPKTCPHCGEEI